ncbi:type IV pilin [Methanosarcina sp. KYL-1]|uniref:type IV pilin n=1 Tax=Methanosarcina sp. KYL-1 TaxID=2602068 RepID=UPI0021007BAC|nr:type IV pilin [Methanosarcina sp. KYL-1]MCQ1534706.1 type IV pilin [Methanosarcina sp. KYL-1]
MDLKNIFKNNSAVSPVIGVVLMVAITVILAAAIGSSVFGQGPARSAPQANLDITAVNVSANADDDIGKGYIKFEHLGGDPIYFESNSTTKVMAALGGTSEELDVTGLGTLDVGDMLTIDMRKYTNTTSDYPFDDLSSGDTVNIKIIDVQTKQLICDKDVRF